MTLTKKQHDEIARSGVKLPLLATVLVWVVKPPLLLLSRIGFARRYLEKTSGARFGAIFKRQKRGEYDKAADLAIDALKAFRHRGGGRFDGGFSHLTWWRFMHYAVVNLQYCTDTKKWETVIALARDGIEPFEGYDVAYAFHMFARLKFAHRDYETALEFATIASRADETWAEPDLLLGRHALAVGGGDAMAHLSRAVRKDQTILFRIANDNICGQHPQIIARLKELSRDGLVTGPDGAEQAEG